MIDLESVLAFNKAQLEQIDREIAGLTSKTEQLRRKLDVAQAALQRKQVEREVLQEAERTWRRRNSPSAADAPMSGTEQAEEKNAPQPSVKARPKARIGDQRYHMLSALRGADLSINEIAVRCGLQSKRVRDQMLDDIREGIVQNIGSKYSLTEAGKELLERFEAYRRSTGRPLPVSPHAAAASNYQKGVDAA